MTRRHANVTDASAHRTNHFVQLLRAKAAGALAEAEAHGDVQHRTVVGRAREILVGHLLEPFLASGQNCVTGQVVDHEGAQSRTTQDDIVIFDSHLAPALLFGRSATDGLLPSQGALARVEVKSVLDGRGIEQFVASSAEISRLRIPLPVPNPTGSPVTRCVNLLFAFRSAIKDPIKRLEEALGTQGPQV